MLLRHLVVLEKDEDETDAGRTSTSFSNEERLVFAQFSVKGYLTTPEYMASDLRPSFAVDMRRILLNRAYIEQLNRKHGINLADRIGGAIMLGVTASHLRFLFTYYIACNPRLN